MPNGTTRKPKSRRCRSASRNWDKNIYKTEARCLHTTGFLFLSLKIDHSTNLIQEQDRIIVLFHPLYFFLKPRSRSLSDMLDINFQRRLIHRRKKRDIFISDILRRQHPVARNLSLGVQNRRESLHLVRPRIEHAKAPVIDRKIQLSGTLFDVSQPGNVITAPHLLLELLIGQPTAFLQRLGQIVFAEIDPVTGNDDAFVILINRIGKTPCELGFRTGLYQRSRRIKRPEIDQRQIQHLLFMQRPIVIGQLNEKIISVLRP